MKETERERERERERAKPEDYYLFIKDESTYEKEMEIQLHNTPPKWAIIILHKKGATSLIIICSKEK